LELTGVYLQQPNPVPPAHKFDDRFWEGAFEYLVVSVQPAWLVSKVNIENTLLEPVTRNNEKQGKVYLLRQVRAKRKDIVRVPECYFQHFHHITILRCAGERVELPTVLPPAPSLLTTDYLKPRRPIFPFLIPQPTAEKKPERILMEWFHFSLAVLTMTGRMTRFLKYH